MARPTLSRVRHACITNASIIAATCEQRRAERCLVPEAAARHKNQSRAIVRDAEAGDPRKAFRYADPEKCVSAPRASCPASPLCKPPLLSAA